VKLLVVAVRWWYTKEADVGGGECVMVLQTMIGEGTAQQERELLWVVEEKTKKEKELCFFGGKVQETRCRATSKLLDYYRRSTYGIGQRGEEDEEEEGVHRVGKVRGRDTKEGTIFCRSRYRKRATDFDQSCSLDSSSHPTKTTANILRRCNGDHGIKVGRCCTSNILVMAVVYIIAVEWAERRMEKGVCDYRDYFPASPQAERSMAWNSILGLG
jgi:hypothetical protein